MLNRTLAAPLQATARNFRVLSLFGPRQSGKTTLCRAAFPAHAYVSLEAPDAAAHAQQDPRSFLRQFAGGVILDEIQRAPHLLSYIQVEVDANPQPGRYIVSGSQQLAMAAATSQSLAGRTSVSTLMPLDAVEQAAGTRRDASLEEALCVGGYPVLHASATDVRDFMPAYVQTYLERDVRQLRQVGDLLAFQTFLGLCAGRCGQLLNLAELGRDAGIAEATARQWLSVLEASWLVFRLPPWHVNLGKRLVKQPKLYFWDTGLCAWLLGVRHPEALVNHAHKGGLFENLVVAETAKAILHAGDVPRLWFYRDSAGVEVDLLVERDGQTLAAEIKAGRTVASDWLKNLHRVRAAWELAGRGALESRLVFGGDGDTHDRSGVTVCGWRAHARDIAERYLRHGAPIAP